MQPSNTRLWIECIALSLVFPTVFFFASPQRVLFISLWVLTITMIIVMRRHASWNWRAIMRTDQVTWPVMMPLLKRFSLSALALAIATILFEPDRLFAFVLERPAIWAMVMLLYPLLSVFPQEIIYRTFYFWRYAPILPSPSRMIWVSGLAFGYGHIVFGNWPAFILSCIGGVMFSQTYSRTKSLAVVWIEHALYGCFIFTIGLGWYFYSGAAR